MLDRSRINDRISEIRTRLNILRDLPNNTDEESFITDLNQIATATERHLEVTIQACLDIAAHLVAQMALEKPKENKDLFRTLANHKIISISLTKKLIAMTGMRNVLIHQYLKVQRDKIYQTIKNDLGDIVEFVKQIELFLEKKT